MRQGSKIWYRVGMIVVVWVAMTAVILLSVGAINRADRAEQERINQILRSSDAEQIAGMLTSRSSQWKARSRLVQLVFRAGHLRPSPDVVRLLDSKGLQDAAMQFAEAVFLDVRERFRDFADHGSESKFQRRAGMDVLSIELDGDYKHHNCVRLNGMGIFLPGGHFDGYAPDSELRKFLARAPDAPLLLICHDETEENLGWSYHEQYSPSINYQGRKLGAYPAFRREFTASIVDRITGSVLGQTKIGASSPKGYLGNGCHMDGKGRVFASIDLHGSAYSWYESLK